MNNKFIEKSNIIHNYKYDYSLVEYNNNYTKVKIICPIHGVFEQSPKCHYLSGCKKCSNLNKSNHKNFIKKSNKIHQNKYDYSLTNYVNQHTKVKIICPIHGVFEQIASNHTYMKHGCPKCHFDKVRQTDEEFIEKSKNIHGDKYDYSIIKYINAHTKIKIICKKHGIFEQSPSNHLSGQGCPICYESKGEKTITKLLNEINIKFIKQKKFQNCKNIRQLPFDFYLPEYNTCIEFDGEQHFRSIEKYGGENGLKNRQNNDKIKTNFCQNNNIKLLRIKFDEKDNIIKEKIYSFILKSDLKNKS